MNTIIKGSRVVKRPLSMEDYGKLNYALVVIAEYSPLQIF